MASLAALTTLIFLSVGTCSGSSGHIHDQIFSQGSVIKDHTDGRTLEMKVDSLRLCPNRSESVLRWLATNATKYKYGFEKLYHHNVTSNTQCQRLCEKLSTCAMYEFHPTTKRCIVTTTRRDRSSEVVETGKWICTYKETTYYFPMESMAGDAAARKLLGSGANGTVKQNIKLVAGKVGKALYLNGEGLIDLGSRRNECLGNLKMCKKGLTISFWMKVKMPLGPGGHRPYLRPLKIKKDVTSRVSLFTTNDVSVYFENGELFAMFRSGEYAWKAKVKVGYFLEFMRRSYQDPKRAAWFFASVTWHHDKPLVIWVNGWKIAKGLKKLDAPESSGSSSVQIGYIRPVFDRRPAGKASLDEFRIWDTCFSLHGEHRLYSSEMARMLSMRTGRLAETRKSRARPRKSKQSNEGERKSRGHTEQIRGVPDSLYHYSMDKIQGTTLEGVGTTAKLVGSCKLRKGLTRRALLLGPKCYIDFGYKQNECIGNLRLCKGGFTMSLWYHDRSKRGERVMYHMSSGGKNPSIIIQAAYPKMRLQFVVGRKAWYQEILYTDMGGLAQFMKKTWRHLLVTWSIANGIEVYIDGQSPRSYRSSAAKMAVEGKLKQNEQDDLIMGVPPGLKRPRIKKSMFSMFHRSNAKFRQGKLEIAELRFWDKALSEVEARKVFAHDNDKVYQKKKGQEKKRVHKFMRNFFG